MQILITTATAKEIQPLLELAGVAGQIHQGTPSAWTGNNNIRFLVTGPGMVMTAYHLGRYFAENRCGLAIGAGIAGSFGEDIRPGEVVWVMEDFFGDTGADEADEFTDLFGLGLIGINEKPFQNRTLSSTAAGDYLDLFRQVKGITVNRSRGKNPPALGKSPYKPEVETMEGAAFYYACLMSRIPCIQIRAVSNMVIPRSRADWQIEEASRNLCEALRKVLSSFPAAVQ